MKSPKHFFLITGPPAVGKMTVGQILRDRLGYRLFHNHQSLELGLTLFNWGEEELSTISNGIRQLVFKTVAESSLIRGFIFTLVWGFELKEDWEYVEAIKDRFEDNGWHFHIVELESSQKTRIERNTTPNRLEHKPSKRDVENSRDRILQMDQKHRMNSHLGELDQYAYLRINNDQLQPEKVVDIIVANFQLINE
ncbi:MAG: AAA family ATPase [Bacteroidia bacterium]|nr:AAA family ATPase [Bacteroidia bacterium]